MDYSLSMSQAAEVMGAIADMWSLSVKLGEFMNEEDHKRLTTSVRSLVKAGTLNTVLNFDEKTFWEFHDAKCVIAGCISRLRPFHSRFVLAGENALAKIDGSLAWIYYEHDRIENERNEAFDKLREKLSLKHATWSVPKTFVNMMDIVPFPGKTTLVLYEYGSIIRTTISKASTYKDLWIAADHLAAAAKMDHIYVEGFEPDPNRRDDWLTLCFCT